MFKRKPSRRACRVVSGAASSPHGRDGGRWAVERPEPDSPREDFSVFGPALSENGEESGGGRICPLALSCNECQESPYRPGVRLPPRAGAFAREPVRQSTLKAISMKFRPLHDRVVIRRIEGEDKTKGGIIIPDTVKEKPQEGEVVAVGPGARDESGKLQPLELKAGDRVLFGKWSGTEVKIDGEDLLIMKESDVMGVIEGAVSEKKKAA